MYCSHCHRVSSACEYKCLQLPTSPLQPGTDPQDSYRIILEQTITSLPQYSRDKNAVFPGSTPQSIAPTSVKRALAPSGAHPLVYRWASPALVIAVSSRFSITQWKTDCEARGISLGTIVFAVRPSPNSAFITCDLIPFGPFLGFPGMWWHILKYQYHAFVHELSLRIIKMITMDRCRTLWGELCLIYM